MTAYVHRLALAAGWIEAPGSRAGSRLVRKMGAALQAVQCAQMISVLNQLPDKCLREAGLRRDDIPEHARRTIYGEASIAELGADARAVGAKGRHAPVAPGLASKSRSRRRHLHDA
ncbi:MAG TPA: hypothetical protein VMO81_01310 [Aestuariivirgaceae bacterium]|nr:hypothetical protein [Aestuariivirgaceae bacterium]